MLLGTLDRSKAHQIALDETGCNSLMLVGLLQDWVNDQLRAVAFDDGAGSFGAEYVSEV